MLKISNQQAPKIHIVRTLVLSLSFILSISASGQTKQGFGAAASLGFNFTQVDGDAAAGFRKVGGTGGVRGYYHLNDQFNISLDILYSQKGSFQPSSGNTTGFKLILDYAELPLMINYNDRDRLIFGVGVAGNRLARVKLFNDDLEIDNPRETLNLTDFEFEFVVNGILMFGSKFGTNIKYGYSMFPVGRSSASGFLNKGLYNQSISVRAMYFF